MQKYIVIKYDDQEMIFVFPKSIDHDRMFEAIQVIRKGTGRDWNLLGANAEVVSAGFVTSHQCHGRSETLNVDSRPRLDTRLLLQA